MIRSKNWRKMSDSQIRSLLADPNADEAVKDAILLDGMRKVQDGWSPKEERSRRKWCDEPADTHVVGVQCQLAGGTTKFLRRLLDRCSERERTNGEEEED